MAAREKNEGLKPEKQLSYTWKQIALRIISYGLPFNKGFLILLTIARNEPSTYMYKTVVSSPEKG